ncbi:MAG: VWA domain-containing protein [Deltaproteobacteria bacterium]|nr:VWA domain-containing protein [Deltaproteobacteria bacterium]
MNFAEPVVAALAPFVGLGVLGIAWVGERRRQVLIERLGELAMVKRMMVAASPRRRWIKASMLAVVATLFTLIAAGPGTDGEAMRSKRGLDLVVALDVSKSMTTADLPPSRLSHARAAIASLLDQLVDDRVAVVVYAGGAVHFPLSEDREVAVELMNDIGPADLPPGSDTAEALRVARCLLRPDLQGDLGCGRVGRRGHGGDPLTQGWDEPAKPEPPPPVADEPERGKAIMIFTDGGGDVERIAKEVMKARDLGIAVFWVGVGTDVGGQLPELDEDGRPTGRARTDAKGAPIVTKLDRATLQQLATAGGDVQRYLDCPAAVDDADGGRTVDGKPLVLALADVQRGERMVKDDRRRNVYHWFLFPAFMLIVIEACIPTRRRKVIYPEAPPP